MVPKNHLSVGDGNMGNHEATGRSGQERALNQTGAEPSMPKKHESNRMPRNHVLRRSVLAKGTSVRGGCIGGAGSSVRMLSDQLIHSVAFPIFP